MERLAIKGGVFIATLYNYPLVYRLLGKREGYHVGRSISGATRDGNCIGSLLYGLM